MRATRLMATACLALAVLASVRGAELFVEAESFSAPAGWTAVTGATARTASGLGLLSGRSGATNEAAATVEVKDAGHYRIWVRYMSQPNRRGPFRVTALAGGRTLGSAVFDTAFRGDSARNPGVWEFLEADLPEGSVSLRLGKEAGPAPAGEAQVDCLLLTMDPALKPNHLFYGAQTYMRVTLGEGYDRPVYIHIFADHFRAPWYQHYSLGKSGPVAAIWPRRAQDLLVSGESTPWCAITPLLYQDSGAMLNVTARHGYTSLAERLRATVEFATAPDPSAVVRTLRLDLAPAGFAVFVPPNLLSPEWIARLKTDREIAEETGRQADAHPWPTYGRRPERFPFFVTEQIQSAFTPRTAEVVAREQKTLDYFGFTDERGRRIGGAWYAISNSYCRPDLAKMKAAIESRAAAFCEQGGDPATILYAELMDEPTGQPLAFMAADEACVAAFRKWLKGTGLAPADLLVDSWDAVRIVTEDQKKAFPALYAYSQRFRTRALGDFMAFQREMLETAYGRSLPTVVNFSDGAVYAGNFYAQGVDYFELLDSPGQNAIWGEDWANLSSTYQCGSYNVDLMRGAARERGQVIGHHLISHAGRKAWDIKLKATSELARGVKILNNFCYGPSWATHEGGPYWRSHVWHAKPETWTAQAELVREVGGVEDFLVDAMPAPARIALLYSSASDIWTIGSNLAYGFDRMHTWLALTHGQVPVDVVSERQVGKGALAAYRVCYLSGPNLDRVAAARLREWVKEGGTLWLTAGAATRDEFDRPLDGFEAILPAARGPCADTAPFAGSGRTLRLLNALDQVRWEGGQAEVLSVRQTLAPRDGVAVMATFQDGSAALVSGAYGKGRIYLAGFLPALSYIKSALVARAALEEKAKADPAALAAGDREMLERSANPWAFPADVRALLLAPVREAKIDPPIVTPEPLVDAVCMTHPKGLLVPLANYANRPVERLALSIRTDQPVARVESVRRGRLPFKQAGGRVETSLPLDNNDFVTLVYGPAEQPGFWRRLFGGAPATTRR